MQIWETETKAVLEKVIGLMLRSIVADTHIIVGVGYFFMDSQPVKRNSPTVKQNLVFYHCCVEVNATI